MGDSGEYSLSGSFGRQEDAACCILEVSSLIILDAEVALHQSCEKQSKKWKNGGYLGVVPEMFLINLNRFGEKKKRRAATDAQFDFFHADRKSL